MSSVVDDIISANEQLDFSRLVQFKFLTSATYHSLKNVRTNYIYFLVDTKEIYKGGLCFTNCINKVRELPADPSPHKIYFNTVTKQLMYYDIDEQEWMYLLTPIIDSFDDDEALGTVTITARAIKEYIDNKIAELYESLGKEPGYNTVPIFDSYDNAVSYAKNSPLAKPGQCVTAPSTKNPEEHVLYVIQEDRTLKEYPSLAQVEKMLEWRAE